MSPDPDRTLDEELDEQQQRLEEKLEQQARPDDEPDEEPQEQPDQSALDGIEEQLRDGAEERDAHESDQGSGGSGGVDRPW